ncbi:MAG: glycosyltransferase family 4 protein [Clostridiaceae bacterium]|nr:glycosyltransferase family 4 protein [Clostridiaceae bacterium]
MNILYINHYAGSVEMGMEFRPYYLAKEWVKMGHQVTIIAADFSHLRQINPKINKDFTEEMIDGIKYVWLKTRTYEGNGVSRAITMFQFVTKILCKSKQIVEKYKPDLVITSSTYPLDTYAGQRIAKKSKAKLIHEIHDLWPLTLIELGGMSKYHPFIVLLQIAENSAYKNSDYVVSLLKHADQYAFEHGLEKDRFVYIPNGVVPNQIVEPTETTEVIAQKIQHYKLQGKFIVGYLGGHALSNSLEDLVLAAKDMQDDNIYFVLIGDGVEKPNLMQQAEKLHLNNVEFFDPVPKTDVPYILESFDCGYIGAMDSPLYRFGVGMNKIFDYMYAGLPIVCAITTPSSPVMDENCGISLDSGDTNGIKTAILTFANMTEDELKEIGLKGKEAVIEKYTYNKLAKKFLEIF